MSDNWETCFFCKTIKTTEWIGDTPVCGNCLVEIYEKGKKICGSKTGGDLEMLILNYFIDSCPDCCMDKQKLAGELAGKIAGLLSDRCPEGGCHAGVF